MGKNTGNKNFREMEIYKEARALNKKIFKMTSSRIFRTDYSLIDQMRRAAKSVMFNFAEGFGKKTNKDKIHYMFNSKGSCNEIRAQIDAAIDQEFIDSSKHAEIEEKCVYIISMLSKYVTYLKKSDTGK